MSKVKKNPLGADAKREKAGPKTFKKYLYQYHWAFCRLLDEHSKKNEYAIFIEEHEDVTLADSLDATKTKFEFNQIKEVAKPYTIAALTKKKKGGSVLRKMSEGVIGKTFSHKIISTNLVSTGGFSFKIHKEGYSCEVIKAGQLKAEEIKKIKDHLLSETGSEELIKNLAFIVPNLPANDFENAIKGRISELMNNQAGGLFYNSCYVYDAIIQDLYKKGTNSFDYSEWSEALKKKAVTSKQVQEIIDLNINRKLDSNLLTEVNRILNDEYKLKSIPRRNIVQAFERYYTQCLSERDIVFNDVSRELSSLIDTYSKTCTTAPALEKIVREKASDKLCNYFVYENDLTGAFLYELLRRS